MPFPYRFRLLLGRQAEGSMPLCELCNAAGLVFRQRHRTAPAVDYEANCPTLDLDSPVPAGACSDVEPSRWLQYSLPKPGFQRDQLQLTEGHFVSLAVDSDAASGIARLRPAYGGYHVPQLYEAVPLEHLRRRLRLHRRQHTKLRHHEDGVHR